MAKFQDEQRDHEYDNLLADIIEHKDDVVAKVYRSYAERHIEIDVRKNGGEYVYLIASVYEKGYPPRYLIIDAWPELSDFEARTRQIETQQREFYQEWHRTAQRGKDHPDGGGKVNEQFLDKHSRKVIVTRSEPDLAAITLAKRVNIVLIIQEGPRRFRLADDTT
jgi:hypothetical protein